MTQNAIVEYSWKTWKKDKVTGKIESTLCLSFHLSVILLIIRNPTEQNWHKGSTICVAMWETGWRSWARLGTTGHQTHTAVWERLLQVCEQHYTLIYRHGRRWRRYISAHMPRCSNPLTKQQKKNTLHNLVAGVKTSQIRLSISEPKIKADFLAECVKTVNIFSTW